MTSPISQITVYSNTTSTLGSTLVAIGTFPVDNNSQRSATLRGENYVKICFKSGTSTPIPAFSFIEYDGQLFFVKETYRPVPKGNQYYEYSVKFVSFENMLSKPNAYRKVVVGSGADQQIWHEPDIEVVGNLADIATIVKDAIVSCEDRYEGVFADLLGKVELVNDEININSESKAFSYSGQKISQVLEGIANEYEIDYWFEQVGTMEDGITKMKLHFAKCEILSGDLHVSDKTYPSDPFDKLHPTVSGGLDECTFANEWSGVVQRITPFGSERNINRSTAIVNQMFVSFGKRLRLDYNHSCTIGGTTYQHAYAVKNEDGDLEPLYVDEKGAVNVPGVTTGEESVEKYDDIYPRGHFRVTHVTQRGVDTQIYTVYAIPTVEVNGVFVDMTDAEIDAMQADPDKKLFPIEIADGQTLSLHFESGFLNGREFEVANKTAKMTWDSDSQSYVVDPDSGHWVACFEINPSGDNNDSPQVPYGNLIPRGKFDSSTGYEGDIFAIFNMEMPAFYVESAQNELAQKAYDEIVSILATRPEVKCRGNEVYFLNHQLFIGQRIFAKSDLFGQDNQGQPLEFISRVTNYSHSLSRPANVDFRLCSSRVQGAISTMKGAIADQTNDIVGIDQTARSLSRRAFRDAQEMIGMLQAVVAQMMVVGVERYQFTFTMGIECLQATGSDGKTHFDGLKITAGEIQHTQEPYIKDAFEGHYTLLSETTLKADHSGNAIDKSASDTYRNTPYYLYAVINQSTGQVTMELWATKKDGTDDVAYLLLGILSSEFLDGNYSLRVFNRSNGFTQMVGGTIKTEQIQDAGRRLIIDFSSNPPRIVAIKGAEIYGNIKFLSATDAGGKDISNVGTDVEDAQETADNAMTEALKEIGGENLYGGADPLTCKVGYTDTDVVLKNGVKYIIYLDAIDGNAYSLSAYSKKNGTYSSLRTIITGGSIGTLQHYSEKYVIVQGNGGTLSFSVTGSGANYYYTLTRIMVQKGEKHTAYQAGYLAKALERIAAQEVTSIDGGLLLSALIKLAQGGIVRAGMSGLADYGQKTIDGQTYQSEGVGFWAGGDYSDAIAAACGLLSDMPVLLTKTGILSRIGCFRVVDSDTVSIDNGGMRTFFTLKSISEMGSIGSMKRGEENIEHEETSGSISEYDDYELVLPLRPDSFYSIKNLQIYIHSSRAGSQTLLPGMASAHLVVKLGNTILSDISGVSIDWDKSVTGADGDDSILFNEIEGTSSAYQNLTIKVSNMRALKGSIRFSFEYAAGNEDDFRCCVAARDGLMISSGHNRQFFVRPLGNDLHVLCNLPSYSEDLQIGELYVDDAGFVRQRIEGDNELWMRFKLGAAGTQDGGNYGILDLTNFRNVILPNQS